MAGLNAGAGGHRRWDCEACIVQAASRTELVERLADLARSLETERHLALKDLAFTLNSEPALSDGSRISFVATSLAEFRTLTAEAHRRLADPRCRRIKDARGIYFVDEPPGRQGKIAVLFPGEGAQYPQMLADICIHFPQSRRWFDLMDRAFVDHPRGYLPSQLVFPVAPQPDGADPRLWNMDGAVETVFAANQALYTLLTRFGIQPDMLAGHSSGDYSALIAANWLAVRDDEELLRHIRTLNGIYERISADAAIPNASLLAVGSADARVVRQLLDEHASELSVALDNCPQQLVLCGTAAAIDRAERQLHADGAVTERLPFGRPYHTPLFASFSGPLRTFFDGLELSPSPIDVYSCATASPYPRDVARLREMAVAQWTRPVRFRETIEAMFDAGARIFIEAGPRGNLTGFVENTLRGRGAAAIPMDTLQRRGLVQLHHAVALMAALHVPMNTDFLYARRQARRVSPGAGGADAPNPPGGAVTLSLRLPSLRLTSPVTARATVNAPEASAVSTDMRDRVMGEYFKSMEQFLRVEREVLQAVLASNTQVAAAVDEARPPQPLPPLIDRIVSIDPDRTLVAVCELNLDDHRFLRDHTLGANVSSFDRELAGLPVLPLAVSLEMLAEAASILRPGLFAVGARNLEARRWLVLESERLTLRFTAAVTESSNEVRVEMHEDGAAATAGTPAVEATILFADVRPPVDRAGAFPLRDDRRSKWSADDMYGRTGMFHGPAFQLVRSLDRSGEDGAEATFIGRGYERWLRAGRTPAFLMDPALIDAMGQVVGYWVGDRFDRGLSVFPTRLERLEMRSPALAPNEPAKCRVRVTHVDEDWIRSNIDVVGDDGTVMVRMHRWEDRRLDLPRRFYDFRIAPHEVLLSDDWPGALDGLVNGGVARASRLRLPRAVLQAHGGIWLRVFAYLVLSREERREWQRLAAAHIHRRLDWLAGRIAVKDAVRKLLQPRVGQLRPADVEVQADRYGRPQVRGAWMHVVNRPPHVTIAHSGGEAIAIAVDAGACNGIGVDIEQVGRTDQVVRGASLTPRELGWVATVEEDAREEWTTRVWCAKEAVGKALGCGLSGGGRDLEVCDVDRGRGVLMLVLRGPLEDEHVQMAGRTIVASTMSDGAVVTATAMV